MQTFLQMENGGLQIPISAGQNTQDVVRLRQVEISGSFFGQCQCLFSKRNGLFTSALPMREKAAIDAQLCRHGRVHLSSIIIPGLLQLQFGQLPDPCRW